MGWLLIGLCFWAFTPWLGVWAVFRWLGKLQYQVDRHAYWIGVHHPLIPTSATPEQVRERGYWS